MCLITKKQEPKIAKEDIKVYKILKEDRTTIYQKGFKYEYGETYKTKFGFIPKNVYWTVWDRETGLKLDNLFPNWRNYHTSKEYQRENMICVAQGYHAFENKEDAIEVADSYNNNRVGSLYKIIAFEFIIPKGAEYYTDGFGQIVSNQIKML